MRIRTRRGYDWTERFPLIVEAASRLRATSFVLNGEGVILRRDVSDFDALHDRRRDCEVHGRLYIGRSSQVKAEPDHCAQRSLFRVEPGSDAMPNVYIESRPKGRPKGSPVVDYVVEDHADHVLATTKTQHEAIEWARKQGHQSLVARVRHLNDKKRPDHWAQLHTRWVPSYAVMSELSTVILPSIVVAPASCFSLALWSARSSP